MSTLINILTKTGIASIGAAAMLVSGIGAASADNHRKAGTVNTAKRSLSFINTIARQTGSSAG